MIEDDDREYCVLVNDEEQYSLWPKHLDIPLGWRMVGPQGTRKECLEYVESVWTDITPKSVRLGTERPAGVPGVE